MAQCIKNEVVRFPYYSGNIYKSEAIGYVTLNQFIKAHKNPTQKTVSILNKIDEARQSDNMKDKLRYKKMLNAFTPSVMLEIGSERRYDNIIGFTQLMQIDLDKIPTEQEAIDLKEHIFHTYESIVCSYMSPSKRGVKCLMKIKPILDNTTDLAIEHYKAIHQAVSKEFEQYGYFDDATKNAILPLFLSSDTELLSRSFDEAIAWTDEDWSKPKYVRLNDFEKERAFDNKQELYYYNKVVRITTSRIHSITDNGHPQVRNTALVLGSRVGAGYIGTGEAEQLITTLIAANDYLSKGIKGYVKTALWGIREGSNNPKYF